jgi:hypothetical protein
MMLIGNQEGIITSLSRKIRHPPQAKSRIDKGKSIVFVY